jgi:amino acid permease
MVVLIASQAMASTGIIPGMISCIFCGSVAAFGLYLLSLAAKKAPHRRASFFVIAQLTFPRAAVFFDAAIAIKCFGVSVRLVSLLSSSGSSLMKPSSYLIIIKSLMPSVVTALYHDLASSDTNPPEWALSSHVWITLITIILAPLAFLRRLDSLRHASYVALFSVGTPALELAFVSES